MPNRRFRKQLLFLFIIFNPWTDFDFVCCRKDSCAGIPAKLGGAEVWEEK
jgi:hypothetical protein